MPFQALCGAGDRTLTEEEAGVLAAVDGSRSVQEIIDFVGSGTFQVAALLYRLVAARVVALRAQAPKAMVGSGNA